MLRPSQEGEEDDMSRRCFRLVPLPACLVCALSAWAQTDTRHIEVQLTREKQVLESCERSVETALATIQPMRKERVEAQRKVVASLEQALAAARAGNTARLREAQAQVSNWQYRSAVLDFWGRAVQDTLHLPQLPPDADDREKQIHQRVRALLAESAQACSRAAVAAGDLDRKALEQILREASGKRTTADLLKQVLRLAGEKRQLETQRPQEDALKAVYAERVKLQDELLSLANAQVDLPLDAPGEKRQEIGRKQQKVYEQIGAWQFRWEGARLEAQTAKELAALPPEQRALGEETVAAAREALKLRQDAAAPGRNDQERRQLELQAEAAGEKESILRQVAEAYAKSAALTAQVAAADQELAARAVEQQSAKDAAELERLARERLDLLAKSWELRLQAVAKEYGEQRLRESLDRNESQMQEIVSSVQGRKAEFGGEPGREKADAFKAQLEERARQFNQNFPEEGTISAIAEPVRQIYGAAQGRVDKAIAALEGKDVQAARAGLGAAWNLRRYAEDFEGCVAQRNEIENRLRKKPELAARPEVKEALDKFAATVGEYANSAIASAGQPDQPAEPDSLIEACAKACVARREAEALLAKLHELAPPQ
jgi:hypothetical protein